MRLRHHIPGRSSKPQAQLPPRAVRSAERGRGNAKRKPAVMFRVLTDAAAVAVVAAGTGAALQLRLDTGPTRLILRHLHYSFFSMSQGSTSSCSAFSSVEL